jgi:hypothetical protein
MFAARLTPFDWMTTSISVRRPVRGFHVLPQPEVDEEAWLPYRQRGLSLSIPYWETRMTFTVKKKKLPLL